MKKVEERVLRVAKIGENFGIVLHNFVLNIFNFFTSIFLTFFLSIFWFIFYFIRSFIIGKNNIYLNERN
jgi:hypothetical protein